MRLQGEDGKARTIRLYQIDAPEWNQPFGKEATEYLAGLVKDKMVSIIVRGRDGYGRDIADLYVDDLWVIGRLVENGYAWNYTTYSDSEELAALEKQAREAKRGLWADPSPISPWDYRKQKSGRTDLSSVITDKSALYATKFGKKYHRSDCKFLTKTAVPVTLEEAKRRGLEPCASCRP